MISSFIGIRVEMQNLGGIKVRISSLIRPPIVLNTEPKVVSMDMDVGDYDIRPRIMLFHSAWTKQYGNEAAPSTLNFPLYV